MTLSGTFEKFRDTTKNGCSVFDKERKKNFTQRLAQRLLCVIKRSCCSLQASVLGGLLKKDFLLNNS